MGDLKHRVTYYLYESKIQNVKKINQEEGQEKPAWLRPHHHPPLEVKPVGALPQLKVPYYNIFVAFVSVCHL